MKISFSRYFFYILVKRNSNFIILSDLFFGEWNILPDGDWCSDGSTSCPLDRRHTIVFISSLFIQLKCLRTTYLQTWWTSVFSNSFSFSFLRIKTESSALILVWIQPTHWISLKVRPQDCSDLSHQNIRAPACFTRTGKHSTEAKWKHSLLWDKWGP